jgi:hypothetical protein
MEPMPRSTVRRLIGLIAAIAVVLWLLQSPILRMQAEARFRSRRERGKAVIDTYRRVCPLDISAPQWNKCVNDVDTLWKHRLLDRDRVTDGELDELLLELYALAASATPPTAEGHLYAINDLLFHGDRRRNGGRYWRIMRLSLRDTLQGRGLSPGRGRKSAGVVNYALSLAGVGSETPFDTLKAALAAPDWRTRAMACRGLDELGRDGQLDAIVQAEIVALADADPLVRAIALESIEDLGASAAAAAPRFVAAHVLAKLDPAGEVAIPALTAALQDRHPSVRCAAATLVGDYGPNAQAAAERLNEHYRNDDDDDTRWAAVFALGKVGGIPALTEAIRHGTKNERMMALASLGKIASTSTTALYLLREALRDPDDSVRAEATYRLAGIGQAAK